MTYAIYIVIAITVYIAIALLLAIPVCSWLARTDAQHEAVWTPRSRLETRRLEMICSHRVSTQNAAGDSE